MLADGCAGVPCYMSDSASARECNNARSEQLVRERPLVERVPLIVLRDHHDDSLVVPVGFVCCC